MSVFVGVDSVVETLPGSSRDTASRWHAGNEFPHVSAASLCVVCVRPCLCGCVQLQLYSLQCSLCADHLSQLDLPSLVVSLLASKKASRALMATDLALMEAPAATFSPRNRSDEFAEEEKAKSVETLSAAASPATDAAVEDGDTAPSTMIQLAAESVAECDKPEPPLGQEASGSAREEEGESKRVCFVCVCPCWCVWVSRYNGGTCKKSCFLRAPECIHSCASRACQQHSC